MKNYTVTLIFQVLTWNYQPVNEVHYWLRFFVWSTFLWRHIGEYPTIICFHYSKKRGHLQLKMLNALHQAKLKHRGLYRFMAWLHKLMKIKCTSREDFHFFHRGGAKILGRVQVICNMPFLMLRERHKIVNQSAPVGVKRHSGGVKHFLRGVNKNLGG